MTPPAWPWPRLVAHRGAGRAAPENTLAAMQLGFARGARAFEFDVKLAADGEPYLLHDDSLLRTCGVDLPGDSLSLAELARLDASRGFPAFAGAAVPDLRAVAAFLRTHDCAANIEIKPMPGAERATGAAVARAAARLWAGAALPPLLSSFSCEALQAAREAAAALPRAWLVEDWPDDVCSRLRALGAVALVAECSLLNAARVAQLHEAGFAVACYTAADLAQVRAMQALGVEAVICDALEAFA